MNNNIKLEEFDALIKITVEMSRYLYPYIREILQSKEDPKKNLVIWNDFHKRFSDLINERYNINSMKVKKLLNNFPFTRKFVLNQMTKSLFYSSIK